MLVGLEDDLLEPANLKLKVLTTIPLAKNATMERTKLGHTKQALKDRIIWSSRISMSKLLPFCVKIRLTPSSMALLTIWILLAK